MSGARISIQEYFVEWASYIEAAEEMEAEGDAHGASWARTLARYWARQAYWVHTPAWRRILNALVGG